MDLKSQKKNIKSKEETVFWLWKTHICLTNQFSYVEYKYKLLFAKIVHKFLKFKKLYVTIYI